MAPYTIAAQLGNIEIHRQNPDLLDLMRIDGPPSPPTTVAITTAQQPQLRVGELLEATVIKQLTSHTVLLQLLNPSRPASGQPTQPLQLRAETTQPLVVGQRLQLEVSQLGEKPLLKVLGQITATDTVIRQAFMQNLPRQTGMAPLLANLVWINQPQNATAPLPQAIQVLAKELLARLPNREKISTADGVKQAFKDSGIFLEGKLGQSLQKPGGYTPGNDLKSLLLQLLSTVDKTSTQTGGAPSLTPSTVPVIPSTPPTVPGGRPQPQGQAEATLATLNNTFALLQELGKQSEGSIARTQLHQLASYSAQDQNPLTWSFELPVRHQERVDLLQFYIEEQKNREDKEQQRRWSVTIALNLEPLGPMHVRLQLEGGKISTTFWAGSAETTALISQNLTELAQRYQQAGIESRDLRCFQGEPPETSRQTPPIIVLDVNA